MRYAGLFVFFPRFALRCWWGICLSPTPSWQRGSKRPASCRPDPGRDITASTCSKCHSLANITSQRKDRDGWSATVTKMVGYGATGER